MTRRVRWFYHEKYNYGAGLPVRQVHGFVLDKPRRIRDRLIGEHGVSPSAFETPTAATREDLERAHTSRLIDALEDQKSVAAAVELPALRWLPGIVVRRAVVDPQILACGGTIAALRAALDGDWCVNLSGGYHHARPDLSHGFCLVNDVAVAIARVRHEGHAPRAVVLDLDLHQGDGNAAMFADDESVFTVSMHEADVFPTPKLLSDLDVGLESYTGPERYLEQLDALLEEVGRRFPAPDVVLFVAGSDPFEEDPLGTLTVGREAMVERDRRVAQWVAEQGCALVAMPAGGYTKHSPDLNADGFATFMRA